MTTPPWPRIYAAIAIFLTIAAYYPALQGDFFTDDFVYVEGNESLQVPLSQFWKLFVSRANTFEYLPIRDLSYWLDTKLFGNEPMGYHAHNLLLYALTCIAVWFCTTSLLCFFTRYGSFPGSEPKRFWIAAATTTLFAVHPAHVESVAWISGRKELLAGFFCLLSLHFFTSALCSTHVHRWKLVTANFFFLFALLSKASVIPFALLALLLSGLKYQSEEAPMSQCLRKGLLLAAPMLLLAAGSLILNWLVSAETGVRPASDPGLTDISSFLLPVKILGTLVQISFFPIQPHLTYDVLQPGVPAVSVLVLGFCALMATAVALVFLFKRKSITAFSVIFFVFLCLPYLQLIPFQTWSLASERFLFLSLYGLALLLAISLSRLPALPSILCVVMLAIAGIGVTYSQSRIWSSNETLFMSNAERAPHLYVAQLRAISMVLLPEHQFDEAEALAARVRDPLPRNTLLHYVRAAKAISEGDLGSAELEADWLASAQGTNGPVEILFFLGTVYEKTNRHSEAARYYHWAMKKAYGNQEQRNAQAGLLRIQALYQAQIEALRQETLAHPGELGPAGTLANLQMELYFLEEAEASFQALLRVHPNHPLILYNLGLTYKRMEEDCLAEIQFQSALQAEFVQPDAWNNLGVAAWQCQNLEEATAAFQEALASDPQYWYAAVNQGRMHLTQGDHEEARNSFLEARRRIALTGGSTEVIDLYLETISKK